MPEKFMQGNEAIACAAIAAGVKVVAGYPGTPATEIVEACANNDGIYAEWSANEKNAFEVAAGASLTNQRAMAVMKHNGPMRRRIFSCTLISPASRPVWCWCRRMTLGDFLRKMKRTLAYLPTFMPTCRCWTQRTCKRHRALLYALKSVVRQNGGVVTGDIGCHDAGTFAPMQLQATIYCMGSSIPMAHGIKAAGFAPPVYALIGDSTFFHNGITGLASAIYNQSDITVVVAYNGTTAMTGFQPHPGSRQNIAGRAVTPIDPGAVAEAMGATVLRCNPYDVAQTQKILADAAERPGVKVVVVDALCYLKFGRAGRTSFASRPITVNTAVCNGCGLCVRSFGCPAISLASGHASVDSAACNGCGVCTSVCQRGAIK